MQGKGQARLRKDKKRERKEGEETVSTKGRCRSGDMSMGYLREKAKQKERTEKGTVSTTATPGSTGPGP